MMHFVQSIFNNIPTIPQLVLFLSMLVGTEGVFFFFFNLVVILEVTRSDLEQHPQPEPLSLIHLVSERR